MCEVDRLSKKKKQLAEKRGFEAFCEMLRTIYHPRTWYPPIYQQARKGFIHFITLLSNPLRKKCVSTQSAGISSSLPGELLSMLEVGRNVYAAVSNFAIFSLKWFYGTFWNLIVWSQLDVTMFISNKRTRRFWFSYLQRHWRHILCFFFFFFFIS